MERRMAGSRDTGLGTDAAITRRDFVGGTLLGAGAALLAMKAPGVLRAAEVRRPPSDAVLGPDWTGPGGIGDYRRANGNTHEVVNAAHSLRDGQWIQANAIQNAVDAGSVDMVVVGGGFAGLMAAYTFHKEGKGTCLLLDNHAIFGGEA
jgi:spermidine dehydrogenase